MMYLSDNLTYSESDNAQMVVLEYKESSLKALIILPKQLTKEAFHDSLSEENIQMQGSTEEVILQLPKFEIESSFPKLVETLKNLGVKKIFENIDCKSTLGK